MTGPRSPLVPRKAPGIVETLSGDDGSDESNSSVMEHSGPSHAGSRPGGSTATPSLTDPLAWADALAGWAPVGQAGGIRREAESSDDSSSPANQPFNPSVEGSASDPGSGSTQDNNDIILANIEIEPQEGPALDSLARRNRDAGLINHFESHVLSDLPVQLTFGRQYMENSCFRKAVMALSSLHLSYIPNRDGTAGNRRQNGEAVGREYYLAAVRELHKRLDLSDQRSREQHAAAALMLAYYEIETGSPLGSLRHARGVDALLSKMDLTSVSMPDLFRAWRLLHYDVKVIANPYRESTLVVDAHDPYSMLDPQLAIRDIFSQLWHLNGRYSMEAPFSSGGGHGSPAQQAAFWTRDALNRVCDKKNCERGDYHKDPLTPDMVIQKCERLTRWMDQWHASSVAEYPTAKLSGAQPFIHGSSFEPFAPLGFSSDRKAHEYLLYVASRLIASYLMSVVGNSSSASTTEAWARMLLGIVCGLERQEVIFTYVQTDALLCVAALLCEGSRTIDAVIEGAIPHILNGGIREADLSEWVYLQKILETARKERMKGKAIRAVCMGLDEDYERRQFQNCCSWAAFGDYNGKGYFREVYTFDS